MFRCPSRSALASTSTVSGSPAPAGRANAPRTARHDTRHGGTSMTVRIGVIGAGMIGRDHIRRLTEVVPGAEVVAVADVDPERAAEAAAGAHARVLPTGHDVIADTAVD